MHGQLCEYVLLWEKLDAILFSPSVSDRFCLEVDGRLRCQAHDVHDQCQAHLEGCGATQSEVLLFWLALHGRLWTAERHKHHGVQLDATCALCDQLDETTDHLLISCVFLPRGVAPIAMSSRDASVGAT